MHYHFRDMLCTVINHKDGSRVECYEGFEAALSLAYTLSAQHDKNIHVYRESETAGVPAFTVVAEVRACK